MNSHELGFYLILALGIALACKLAGVGLRAVYRSRRELRLGNDRTRLPSRAAPGASHADHLKQVERLAAKSPRVLPK